MLERTLTKIDKALAANLNQAEDTVLLTFVAIKPIVIHRFGVNADAAEGLLSAMRLKMRKVPLATGTPADLSDTTLNPGGAIARGNGVYKVPGTRHTIDAGDSVTVAVDTAAGATSTGDVWLEYEELPFAGELIENMSESA